MNTEGCWGGLLHDADNLCTPGFVAGKNHFKNKFCPACHQHGIRVASERLCVVASEEPEEMQNGTAFGFWKASTEYGAYRLVNQTAKCLPPAYVLLADPSKIGNTPLLKPVPEQHVEDDGCVLLYVCNGTLVPAASAPPGRGRRRAAISRGVAAGSGAGRPHENSRAAASLLATRFKDPIVDGGGDDSGEQTDSFSGSAAATTPLAMEVSSAALFDSCFPRDGLSANPMDFHVTDSVRLANSLGGTLGNGLAPDDGAMAHAFDANGFGGGFGVPNPWELAPAPSVAMKMPAALSVDAMSVPGAPGTAPPMPNGHAHARASPVAHAPPPSMCRPGVPSVPGMPVEHAVAGAAGAPSAPVLLDQLRQAVLSARTLTLKLLIEASPEDDSLGDVRQQMQANLAQYDAHLAGIGRWVKEACPEPPRAPQTWGGRLPAPRQPSHPLLQPLTPASDLVTATMQATLWGRLQPPGTSPSSTMAANSTAPVMAMPAPAMTSAMASAMAPAVAIPRSAAPAMTVSSPSPFAGHAPLPACTMMAQQMVQQPRGWEVTADFLPSMQQHHALPAQPAMTQQHMVYYPSTAFLPEGAQHGLQHAQLPSAPPSYDPLDTLTTWPPSAPPSPPSPPLHAGSSPKTTPKGTSLITLMHEWLGQTDAWLEPAERMAHELGSPGPLAQAATLVGSAVSAAAVSMLSTTLFAAYPLFWLLPAGGALFLLCLAVASQLLSAHNMVHLWAAWCLLMPAVRGGAILSLVSGQQFAATLAVAAAAYPCFTHVMRLVFGFAGAMHSTVPRSLGWRLAVGLWFFCNDLLVSLAISEQTLLPTLTTECLPFAVGFLGGVGLLSMREAALFRTQNTATPNADTSPAKAVQPTA